MKYVDASAVLRLLFAEPGPVVRPVAGEHLVSSAIVGVESFRAVDRERLLGHLDDEETAMKRKELTELLARLDLASVDDLVLGRARQAFGINVRALDAIHVATAEILAGETSDEPLEFWTHDTRQAAAALSRGLSVHGLEGQAPNGG